MEVAVNSGKDEVGNPGYGEKWLDSRNTLETDQRYFLMN